LGTPPPSAAVAFTSSLGSGDAIASASSLQGTSEPSTIGNDAATPPPSGILGNINTNANVSLNKSPLRRTRPKPVPKGTKSKTTPIGKENVPPMGIIVHSGTPANDARTESNKVPATTIPVDPDAPNWFQDAIGYFVSAGLGEDWLSLVQLWVDFEKKYKYGGSERQVRLSFCVFKMYIELGIYL
jgi:hypothetical protein